LGLRTTRKGGGKLNGAGRAKETAAYYDVTNINDFRFSVNIYNKFFLRFFIFINSVHLLYYLFVGCYWLPDTADMGGISLKAGDIMPFAIEKERSQIRVLIIEDEDYSRVCISDFLELVGFSSIQAKNGREGIELFGQHEPDVVITDILMPEMNGFDILKFIQNYSSETPAIVISGTESLDDVAACIKLGAWDYITKPIYDYGAVEMSILRVLEKKQLLEENRRYREYLEEEVIKRSDELLYGTVRFKTIFNLASDLMIIYDQDGEIIDCNEMTVRHTGYPRKQLLEMNMQQLIADEDAALFTKILSRLPTRNHIMYELRYKCRDGRVTIMEHNATMVVTEAAPLVFVVGRDVTEKRQMESERDELKRQIAAAQKMEIVGLLAGGIAHDFNNVLTALAGYSSLLETALSGKGGVEADYAAKITTIANKGQALTARLMSFIRKKRDELVPVDIHKALKDTEVLLRPNSSNIKITLELNAENHKVLGDESQIQNALLNLSLNARDAMPDGGKLTFRTSNDEQSPDSEHKGIGYIKIDIIDTGTGIDEAIITKIFDPLFTTKAPGEGIGLGLPGVLYCVKNLHGSIDVESTLGAGTTFKVTLPIYREGSLEKIDMSKKQVITVTGDAKAAGMLSARLKQEGISVKQFSDAFIALGWLKDNADKTAAVLIDYELPMFDEISFTDEVSAITSQTLIIKMLCTYMISIGSNKGIRAFVNTPIDSDRFFEAIAEYIRDILLNACRNDIS